MTTHTTKPERKTRTMTQLPTTIDTTEGETIIADLSLPELIDIRAKLKTQLEDVPRMELELKAVVKEIGKKVKA